MFGLSMRFKPDVSISPGSLKNQIASCQTNPYGPDMCLFEEACEKRLHPNLQQTCAILLDLVETPKGMFARILDHPLNQQTLDL